MCAAPAHVPDELLSEFMLGAVRRHEAALAHQKRAVFVQTTPSADETQTAQAVVTPRTGSRAEPLAITPAPMNPTPVHTCAAARAGSPREMLGP